MLCSGNTGFTGSMLCSGNTGFTGSMLCGSNNNHDGGDGLSTDNHIAMIIASEVYNSS